MHGVVFSSNHTVLQLPAIPAATAWHKDPQLLPSPGTGRRRGAVHTRSTAASTGSARGNAPLARLSPGDLTAAKGRLGVPNSKQLPLPGVRLWLPKTSDRRQGKPELGRALRSLHAGGWPAPRPSFRSCFLETCWRRRARAEPGGLQGSGGSLVPLGRAAGTGTAGEMLMHSTKQKSAISVPGKMPCASGGCPGVGTGRCLLQPPQHRLAPLAKLGKAREGQDTAQHHWQRWA